ncbi:MAG: NAD-dependent epimerase/dehydratase family protein [Mucilaginibacter sp.]|nr:NAD-dependent epimerase/dehydratase family protein [Mucilaginibacter sp.]
MQYLYHNFIMRIFAEIYYPVENKAVLAGASGLIGSKLLDVLLQEDYYDEVIALVRHELPLSHLKLVQINVNFEDLEKHAPAITGHVVFCCLGSTRKKTPNLADYRKVDHDYPLQLAQIASKNRVQQYHLVSALGANAGSANFYTKMKGETEEDIMKAGLPALHIYRPALLTGDRKETRTGERIFTLAMKVIDPLLIGPLKKYQSIPAATVARAMFNQSMKQPEGVFIYSSDQIKNLS